MLRLLFSVPFLLFIQCACADFDWPDQISGIEYSLAEVGYQLNKSDITRSRFIFAAEQLIGKHCSKEIAPFFLSLNAEGQKKCEEVIEKLTSIDPENPAITCLTKGYSSNQCFAAFANVQLRSLNDYRNYGDSDVEAALALKTTDANEAEEDLQINGLRQSFLSEGSEEKKNELTTLLIRRINRHCAVVRYYSTPPQPAQPTARPTKPSRSKEKPFQNMLDELNNKLSSTPSVVGPSRFRLVSPQCLNAISDLKSYAADHAAVVCVEKGPFSPQCLRRRKPSAISKKGSGGVGFDPF